MNEVLSLWLVSVSANIRTALCWTSVLGLCLFSGSYGANAGVIPPEKIVGAKLCSAAASGYFGHTLAQEAPKYSDPENFEDLYGHIRCACTLTCTIYQESPLLRFAFGRPGAQDMARHLVRHDFYLISEMCWLENVFRDTPGKVTGDVLTLLSKARNDGALVGCSYTPGINLNWPWSWDGQGKPMSEKEWAKTYLHKDL